MPYTGWDGREYEDAELNDMRRWPAERRQTSMDRVELALQTAKRFLDEIGGDDIYDTMTDNLVAAVRALSAALTREHAERLALEARVTAIIPQTARRDRD